MTDQSSPSLMIKFEDTETQNFYVEYTQKNKDIVYHFFPNGNNTTFINNFGVYLEKAFKKCLPDSADVRADFISLEEASLILRHTDEKGERPPSESFYVCVKDIADNPMADNILKKKVFLHLEEEIENGY